MEFKFGIKSLDDIQLIRRGTTCSITGFLGCGKSVLLYQLAVNAAISGKKVVIFSSDSSKYVKRDICFKCKVALSNSSGQIVSNVEDVMRNIIIFDNTLTLKIDIKAMKHLINYASEVLGGIDLVLFDFPITSSNYLDRDEIFKNIQNLSRKYKFRKNKIAVAYLYNTYAYNEKDCSTYKYSDAVIEMEKDDSNQENGEFDFNDTENIRIIIPKNKFNEKTEMYPTFYITLDKHNLMFT